jgi:RNA polymerase sigma factor for flagellar operon FliA
LKLAANEKNRTAFTPEFPSVTRAAMGYPVKDRRDPVDPSDRDVPTRGPCKRSADISQHRALVKKIANRIRSRLPPSVGLDELEQAGLMGLNEALERFEEGRGSSFESYASRRIEGSMLDALRQMDTLSRSVRGDLRQVASAVQRLEHRLGRPPRAKEVANELGWTLKRFHDCMAAAGAGSIRSDSDALENMDDHSAVWQTNTTDLHSALSHATDPVVLLQQRQRQVALNAAFDTLEEAERYVMEAIYNHEIKMSDIGETLGVSGARVSQIASAVIKKLRARLHDA